MSGTMRPETGGGRAGLVTAVARFAARRRWLVVASWAAGILVLGFLVRQGGGAYVDTFSLPGAPSQQAQDVLKQRFPAQAGDTAILVAYAPAGIQSPASGPRFQELLEQARPLPNVTSVSPPLVSRDGRYSYVVLQYARQAAAIPDSSVQALERLADSGGGNGLTLQVGGSVVSAHEGSGHDPYESVGVVAAGLILLLVFGSFLVMGAP